MKKMFNDDDNEEDFIFPDAYTMFDKSVEALASTNKQLKAIYEKIDPKYKSIKLTLVSSKTIEKLIELNYEVYDCIITNDRGEEINAYEVRWNTPEPVSNIKKRKFNDVSRADNPFASE